MAFGNLPSLNMGAFDQMYQPNSFQPMGQPVDIKAMQEELAGEIAKKLNPEGEKKIPVPGQSSFVVNQESSQEQYDHFKVQQRINELQREFNELAQKKSELENSITGLQTKFASDSEELERAMAANRARRIKKDNDSTEMWRWSKEQKQKKDIADMQYRWQLGQNAIENGLADMTARNEFNGSLNSALSQWQAAKKSGDALAEAYAKEHVDQLITYGQAKFGIDYRSKIKESEGLAKKTAETEAAKKKAEEDHANYIANLKNQIRYLTNDEEREALQANLKKFSELPDTDPAHITGKELDELWGNPDLLTEKQLEEIARKAARVNNAGEHTTEQLRKANNKREAKKYAGKTMNTLTFNRIPEEVRKYLAIDANGIVKMKEEK